MPSIPVWLQVILGVFSILEPQFAWLIPIIKIAYELWRQLPWFHKAGALVKMRQAVSEAKVIKSTSPIEKLNVQLKTLSQHG